MLTVPASSDAGKHLRLGRTYDAAKGTPGIDIFSRDFKKDQQTMNRFDFQYKMIKTSKEARDFLNVSGSFSLKVKAGLMGAEASGKYLSERKNKDGTSEILVKLKCELMEESIRHEDYAGHIKPTQHIGTHFARGVIYGSEMVASLRVSDEESLTRKEIKGEAQGNLNISGGALDVGLKAELEKLSRNLSSSANVQISYYATDNPPKLPTTLEDLMHIMETFQGRIKGVGVPLEYELMPLSTLLLGGFPTYCENPAVISFIERFEIQYDDLRTANDLVVEYKHPVPEMYNFIETLEGLLEEFWDVISALDVTDSGPGKEQFTSAMAKYKQAFPGMQPGPNKCVYMWNKLVKEQRDREEQIAKEKQKAEEEQKAKAAQKREQEQKFNPDEYEIIEEEEWQALREDGIPIAAIKKTDKRRKVQLDQKLSNFVLSTTAKQTEKKYSREGLNIVFVGKTGEGKSATANTLLGQKLFYESMSTSSVTQTVASQRVVLEDGSTISVLDTPGLMDTSRDNKVVQLEVAKCLDMCSDGIHVFFYVHNIASHRFTKEDTKTLKLVKDLFGEVIFKNCAVILTHADNVLTENKTLDSYIDNDVKGTDLEKLVNNYVKRRVVAVNNIVKSKYEKSFMRNAMLDAIDSVLVEAEGQTYTNSHFLTAKRLKEEYESKRRKEQLNDAQKENMRYYEVMNELSEKAKEQAQAYFQNGVDVQEESKDGYIRARKKKKVPTATLR